VNPRRCLWTQELPRNPKQHLQRLRRQIKRLPPYPALFILAAPLAVVEPLKLATVFIAGEGHWITGGLVMAVCLRRQSVCYPLAVSLSLNRNC
jgi:hypothetical protein